MKKKLILLTFVLLIYNETYAQIVEYTQSDAQNLSLSKREILDQSVFRVFYRHSIISDTIKKVPKDHLFLLQIGKKVARYADFYNMQADSLRHALAKQNVNPNTIRQKARALSQGTSYEVIFTNYPTAKITVTTVFGGDSYQYEEPVPAIKWTLEKEEAAVCGYNCKKASCTLFGRNYTAWYAPEIARSVGPWKLSGLPGLILKANDDKGQISFECIGLEKTGWDDPLYISQKNYIKANKKQILKTYTDYKRNPIDILTTSGMIQGNIPANVKKERIFIPIELSE